MLVLNLGSSSFKYGLYEIISQNGRKMVKNENLLKSAQNSKFRDHRTALMSCFSLLTDDQRASIQAIGHRVVHGGATFSRATTVDQQVLSAIEKAAVFAPLHNRCNLLGIEMAASFFGDVLPQVAVFDTAYHQTMPPAAYRYALPSDMFEKHEIRRFGFHGGLCLHMELAPKLNNLFRNILLLCRCGDCESIGKTTEATQYNCLSHRQR